MTSVSAAAGTSITMAQYFLMMMNTYVQYGSYLCPTTISADTAAATKWNYIVVGGGTAGLAFAHRMSECSNTSTLVIDVGGCAPLESLNPGLFTVIPQSNNDYAFSLKNDSKTCQNQQPQGGATAGKMWGGSGSLDHLIHVRGGDYDFESWCTAANDSSWCGDELNKFMAKGENRQKSSYMDFVFDGANELGIPTTDDTLPASGQWINFPLLTIANGTRTCGNAGYMKATLSRSNVKYLTARVDKVIFDGTTATGVQVTASNVTYILKSTKTILSAGAIGSPVILMRSGIGDKTAGDEMGINSVVDNAEVGSNLMDHSGFPSITTFNNSASPTLSGDPHEFPVPTVTVYQAINSSQSHPDCQNIALLFPANSSGFLQLCYNVFKYKADICDAIYNRYQPILFNVHNLALPVSSGSVSLNTTDIYGDPIVKLGLFSNNTDLVNAAACLNLDAKLVNTTAFKSKGAEFLDMGLCNDYTFNTTDYWQCHVLAMSSTMWHYSGTCKMGKVVDASLNVKGTTNLKVIDASVMPGLISGNIASAVRGIAEKAADIVKTEDGCSS